MLWFQKKTEKAEKENNLAAKENKGSLPEEKEESSLEPETALSLEDEFGRRSCLEHLEHVLSSNKEGAVLKLYIENFKLLNQVFGYTYCEQLLNKIIQYLQTKTKQSVYRYIGVEFILVLENYSQGQASILADEIVEAFSHVWKVEDTDCLCSVQIGLCSYPGHALTADDVMKCLDAAVAKASESGPNQVVFYDTALHLSVVRRQTIAKYLQTALDKEEMEIFYYPVFNQKKGKFTRAKFCMRMFIRGIGMVDENEFLSIAEDSGQIRAVEYFALHQAGRCISDLFSQDKDFDSISLQLSSVLLIQEDFLNEVEQVIQKYHIPYKALALEVTANTWITFYPAMNAMLKKLDDLGVELILTDFATGYSSMTSILKLPVHVLKVNRTFICQLETNPNFLPIAEGLIYMTEKLKLPIIAEGAETSRQMELLKGCQYIQGLYFCPGIDHDKLMQIMDTTLEEARCVIAGQS